MKHESSTKVVKTVVVELDPDEIEGIVEEYLRRDSSVRTLLAENSMTVDGSQLFCNFLGKDFAGCRVVIQAINGEAPEESTT